MHGLSSIICSMMVAASPLIQDAPLHQESLSSPSARPEEVAISPVAPLTEDMEMIEAFSAINIDLQVDNPEVAALLEEINTPIESPVLDVQVSKLSEEPILKVSSNSLKNAPISQKENQVLAVIKEGQAQINLSEVFKGAPVIYTVLLLMSIFSFTLWLYHLLLMRKERLMPSGFATYIEGKLADGNWQETLALCRKESNLLAILVSASISARHEGSQGMVERMQAEGKRATSFFWQRLSLLNDIALIAPMIGLLGTVLGMFYAFYDVNRSLESMYTLFDGLGISVGTTVAGLIVAIMALFFHSTLKYSLIRQLALVESNAQKIALHPTSRLQTIQTRETHELGT